MDGGGANMDETTPIRTDMIHSRIKLIRQSDSVCAELQ